MADPEDAHLEAQYRHLIEQVPAIMYVAERGAQGRWFYISPQIQSILGFTPAEWIADPQRWREQLHPDDLEGALAAEATLSQEGDRYQAEYRLRNSAGHYVWVRDEATYVHSQQAGKLVMRGLLLDISKRKEAEQELRKTEQRLLTTVSAAPVVLFALDPTGVFTLSEGSGLQALGLKPGEIVGRSVFEVYGQHPHILEHVRRVLAGHEFTATIELPELQRVYETRWVPTSDGNDHPSGAIGVATDVTERVQLEQQLRTMQGLEAIGRLAGGVAHDFNNLVGIILGHTELLAAGTDLTERVQNGLAQIRRAGERAASLTHQLLAFSRKQVLQPRTLNLNTIVADLQKMLARVIGEDIELVTGLDPALAAVTADPVQIEQVLMNLAVNARDAMPNGGILRIETENVDLDETYVRQHSGVPGPYVRLTVSDTGHGMDPETLAHIFEPFFTTKARGKGTGMGLATVYGIVTQSGGNILVSSALQKGTTFQIHLPAAPMPDEPGFAEIEKPLENVAGGGETILVVEDEPNLREITRFFLESYGYQVLESAAPNAALQLAQTYPGSIHLLLTDVIMPGMSGGQLAEQLVRMRPGLRVVYMTGYTDDMVAHHHVLESGIALLPKPFDKVSLARKIRSVLDAP